MAYTVEGVWSFFDENATGLDSVPLNKIIIVKSNGQMFIKKTNEGITQNTTIKQAIAAGILDSESIHGGASGSGFDYIQETAPVGGKKGEIWFRPSTFEIFVLEENDKWVGSKGTIIEGGQEIPPSPANQAPTAPTNANAFPASVAAGKQVQFIFSGATDTDGTVQSYKVSEISDAIITCDAPIVAAGSPHIFTVGSLSGGGAKSVTFKVSAIDNQGAESNKVQVTTNVQDLQVPTAPTNVGDFPAIICAPGKQGSFTFTGSDIGTHYEVYDFSNTNLTVQQARVAAGQPHIFNGVSETIKVTFKVKAISAQGIDSEPVTVTTKVEKNATQPGSQPEPGEIGFGVGLAPQEIVDYYNLTLLSSEPGNADYGNYRDSSGSIMVWIPKFYFRIVEDTAVPYYGCRFDVSFEPKDGYIVHRAFIDGGKEVPGFFIDKYTASVENQVLVSKRNNSPLVSGTSTGVTTAITNLFPSKGWQNQCGYFLDAVKTRGQAYSLTTTFQFNALAVLADAYYQICYRNGTTSQIGWASKAPYQPKGNNNSLKDYNDNSVTFSQGTGSYSGIAATASCSDANLPKITHNGEKCGVTDVNGNVYKWCIGAKTNGGTSIGILKESVYARSITRSNATTASNYDNVTIPYQPSSYRFGNGTTSPFKPMTDRNDGNYRLNCSGIASNANGISSNGTERFGQDYLYVYSNADCFGIVGGYYNITTSAGMWILYLYSSLTYSSRDIGCSASLYPHMDIK